MSARFIGKAVRRSVIGGATLVAILALTPAGAGGPQGTPAPAGAAEPVAEPVTITTVLPAAVSVKTIASQSTPSPDCVVGVFVGPTGSFVTAPAADAQLDGSESTSFSVEVESGLPVDIGCFADAVDQILNDPRGWGGGFHQVGQNPDIVVRLASPATTDSLCYPLRTDNSLSCANGRGATLNFMRWSFGAEAYGEDRELYRAYLVTHEVGHLLGHDHVDCSGVGDPAPVMMQQTKGVGSCIAQPWPLEWELR